MNKTKNVAVVGAQWGDEGKGKIVDIISKNFDVVARYQGGHNAGHTIRIGEQHFVLHLIPSGIFHKNIDCVIGNGLVLDPLALIQELELLDQANISAEGRLFVSNRCHVILPYHRIIEEAIELELRERRIGTTSRGIGPAYEDKMARRGIRVCDLLNPDTLVEKIQEQVKLKNRTLKILQYPDEIDPNPICESYIEYAKKLSPFFADTSTLMNTMLRDGKRILFEGAQATLLDIDHGTFPYVTSSNSTTCGIPSGLGIAPRHVHSVLGIIKAYTTRVGSGPFPTEANNIIGEQLRAKGDEYGATTGRPRRCGWFDGPAAKYAAMINDMDEFAVTKIDVLDTFDEIPVCIGYRFKGSPIDEFPADSNILSQVEPIYKNLPGWSKPIAKMKEWSDLPNEAQNYLKFLSDFLGRPISMVSTGPDREETIQIPG